ncbi:MAG: hypothetical protein K2X82_16960 [Gemmataceae bacterium]|nr:hypothetical protein [Gemmataceae bacterium]
MDQKWLAVLVTVAFSAVGVLGDYFLKRASEQAYPLKTWPFALGFLVYSSTAFGWLFVMRHLKLATIGVVYSVSMVALLTLVGWLAFGEEIGRSEAVGLVCAVAALVLLTRG